MDGNGRWAQARGLPRSAGHKAGYEQIPEILEACINLGIPVISVFVWSTENWKRPENEVNYVMIELKRNLSKFVNKLHEKGIRFRHIGSHENLEQDLLNKISQAEEITQNNQIATFNFLFNYGSRTEIIDTVRRIASKDTDFTEIAEDTISNELWTGGLPDVDILVRTGREKRLSNFMVWQCAYATIHFLDKYWPDFNRNDIVRIVEQFRTEHFIRK